MTVLSHDERLDWLQLIRTEQIGPVTFHRLIAKYGSARDAIDALPAISKSARRKSALRLSDRGRVEAELNACEELGAHAICACEPDYPAILKAVADPPPVIFAIGDLSLLDRHAVAIIGTRNASMAGRKMARLLAEGLSEEGFSIVSGLARGIDGAAHEASLEAGTIAVVAGGIDVIYPPEHADLTRAIARQGLIISERPPGVRPTARDFPRRNRLISGLSRGVIVVEAAARSGTLITARFALEQGREVFAVPGSPLDPRCEGANRLIRDGATLIESAGNVVTSLAGQLRAIEEPPGDFTHAPDEEFSVGDTARLRADLLTLLSYSPVHRDDLIRELSAPHGLIIDSLIDLVISGEAEEHPGGKFSLSVGE